VERSPKIDGKNPLHFGQWHFVGGRLGESRNASRIDQYIYSAKLPANLGYNRVDGAGLGQVERTGKGTITQFGRYVPEFVSVQIEQGNGGSVFGQPPGNGESNARSSAGYDGSLVHKGE
jgi:hypothetical protein